MERIVNNYDFLLALSKSSRKQQVKILHNASPEQIIAIIDCVKLHSKQKGSVPETHILRQQKRWKRAVLVLKQNAKLLTPVLVSVLCALLREALFYIYTME